MKKNEAISILATSARPREPKDRTRYDEAVKIAINALTAQPEKRTDKRTETHACDSVNRQAAIEAINTWDKFGVDERGRLVRWHEGLEPYVHLRDVLTAIANLPSAQPEQRWIPVTKDTLPIEGKVVIVKGKTGTWDFGTYRGYSHVMGEGDIHLWNWKKKTLKSVYWWMYKDGALPEPTGGEQDETD